MTALSVDNRIADYVDRLPPDDRSEFQRRLEEELDALDLDEKREELVGEFEQSEKHLELITAAASAFDQDPVAGGYESGYQFAITEPLAELNELGEERVSNADVLLVKENEGEAYFCVIECKAGGSDTEKELYDELKDIESTLQNEDYRETLKTQLGIEEKSIQHEQYVILGPPTPIWSLNEERFEEIGLADNQAFWAYIKGDLSIVHVHGEIQPPELARIVKDGVDAGRVENPIKFTFGDDHPLTHLKVMVENLIDEKTKTSDEYPFEFNRSGFYDMFDGFLQVGFEGETREKLVGEKVDYLLDLGLEIGIFTDSSSKVRSRRDYRILFQGQKSSVAKQTTEQKYFDTIPELKLREEAFEAIRGEFSPEQTRVDEWI
jgi:hypothetical protein